MTNSDSESENCSPDELKIRKIVAGNIRKYREAKNYTQEMLAEKMDMTSVTISRLENMMQWPSPRTLLFLTKALEIRPYQLFLEEGAESIIPTQYVMKALERSIDIFNMEINPRIQKGNSPGYPIEHH